MAKLYFRYGAMNSGKSTLLLQTAYNYQERGMNVILMKPSKDIKADNCVQSRLGVNRKVDYLLEFGNSYAYVNNQGYILEISTQKIEGKVKVQGYSTSVENIIAGNRMCQEDLEKLKTVSEIVSIATNLKFYDLITSINIKDENNYKLYLESEEKNVHLGNNTNIDIKMLYVQTIIEKEKGNAGTIYVNRDLNNHRSYFTPAT